MILNDSYAGPMSNLLMLSPLPSVNYAYSLLIRVEKQKEVHISHHSVKSAFYADKQPYGNQIHNSEKRVVSEGNKGQKSLLLDQREMQFFSAEDIVTQSDNSGNKAMTQDQFHNLYKLLQYVKVGLQAHQVTEDNATTNCSGPFNEEANGSW
ncbi:hypothetical protein H5410_002637 [Solanum commersonii]|uniref:Uncharacterized protein n=1 Tax=Solanum commersonii TaxID=4109 RepID=A0A9J6B2P4_SOLCO|nr:hypothetical protein H5410_002637 [Solanum commersonii]